MMASSQGSLKVLARRVSSDDFAVDRTHLVNVPVMNTCPRYQDREPELHDIRDRAPLADVMAAWRWFAQRPLPSKEPESFWARLWECITS
jgi:hypothetical protein